MHCGICATHLFTHILEGYWPNAGEDNLTNVAEIGYMTPQGRVKVTFKEIPVPCNWFYKGDKDDKILGSYKWKSYEHNKFRCNYIHNKIKHNKITCISYGT